MIFFLVHYNISAFSLDSSSPPVLFYLPTFFLICPQCSWSWSLASRSKIPTSLTSFHFSFDRLCFYSHIIYLLKIFSLFLVRLWVVFNLFEEIFLTYNILIIPPPPSTCDMVKYMLPPFEEAVDHGVAEPHGGGGELVEDSGVRVRVVHALTIWYRDALGL